jgi:hypothetical protein
MSSAQNGPRWVGGPLAAPIREPSSVSPPCIWRTPVLLKQMASYDVASNVCLVQPAHISPHHINDTRLNPCFLRQMASYDEQQVHSPTAAKRQ